MENINEIKSFIKKNRILFFLTILFLFSFPFIFNLIFYYLNLFPSKATYDGWFSFISSYTGSICTVVIFLITLIKSHIDKIEQQNAFENQSIEQQRLHKVSLEEQRNQFNAQYQQQQKQFDAKYELQQKQHADNLLNQRHQFIETTNHQEKLHRENLEAQKKEFEANSKYEKFQNCLFLSSKIAPRFELTHVEQYECKYIRISFRNTTNNIAVLNSISAYIAQNDFLLPNFDSDSVFDSDKLDTLYKLDKCIINNNVENIYLKLPESIKPNNAELNLTLTLNIEDYIGNEYIQSMIIENFPRPDFRSGVLGVDKITYTKFKLKNIANTNDMLNDFELQEMLSSFTINKPFNFMNKN